MKLTSLYVHNFKGYREHQFDLQGKSTVLFGVNGAGKSTVLTAINYLMWPVLNRLSNTQGTAFRSLNAESVHAGFGMMNLGADFSLAGETLSLRKDYIKAKPGKAPRVIPYKNLYDTFVEKFTATYLSEGSENNMPIFVNYGTNRSVLDIPLRIRTNHEFSQLTALERASENELDFRSFFEWFRNQEDIEKETKKETKNFDYEDVSLGCVRTAVCSMLDNVSDLKVKRSPLRMTVKKNGLEMRVDNLSDGEKCTLALFGDLARRIALANPSRNNPLEGEGIVLIDEIELHMHPSWQRKILGALKSTFPNIQFIITTHSPQVISEVDDSYNLFGLKQENDDVTVKPYNVHGWDTNGILHSVMHTTERPENVVRAFEAFDSAIECNLEEASKILQYLKETVDPNDPKLTECEVRFDLENR